jgi:hypothetical protein
MQSHDKYASLLVGRFCSNFFCGLFSILLVVTLQRTARQVQNICNYLQIWLVHTCFVFFASLPGAVETNSAPDNSSPPSHPLTRLAAANSIQSGATNIGLEFLLAEPGHSRVVNSQRLRHEWCFAQ